MLNIVTAVTRPHNLPIIQDNLHLRLDDHFPWRWLLVADSGHCQTSQINVPAAIIFSTPTLTNCKGADQKNAALHHLSQGWVYFLDDDNLIHPEFPCTLKHLIHEYPEKRAFIFGQVHGDHSHRLKAQEPQFGYIDTASYVVHTHVIEDASWRAFTTNGHGDDFNFINDIWLRHPDAFLIRDVAVTYYNALQAP